MKTQEEIKAIAKEIEAAVHEIHAREAYKNNVARMSKTYWDPVSGQIFVSSMACMHHLSQRHLDAIAASLSLQDSFEKYRKKVQEEYSLEDLYEALGIPPE